MIDRKDIVAEALTWCGTPWRHEAHEKGAGVDCAQLPRAVLNKFGANIRPTDHYPRDWHMNRDEERFLNFVLEYCVEIDEADLLPGDLILWRIGRCFSHGAIYLGDEKIVHAIVDEGIVRTARISDGRLGNRTTPKGALLRRCFRWKELA